MLVHVDERVNGLLVDIEKFEPFNVWVASFNSRHHLAQELAVFSGKFNVWIDLMFGFIYAFTDGYHVLCKGLSLWPIQISELLFIDVCQGRFNFEQPILDGFGTVNVLFHRLANGIHCGVYRLFKNIPFVRVAQVAVQRRYQKHRVRQKFLDDVEQ